MSTGTSRYSKSIMFLPAAAAADDVLVASDPIDEAIDNVVHRVSVFKKYFYSLSLCPSQAKHQF